MTTIVIAGHYEFPEGMRQTGQFISGVESGVEVCALAAEEGPDQYKEKLRITMLQKPNDDMLVLCDVVGGTPFKAAMQIATEIDKKVRIIAGINLTGLVTGMMLKDTLDVEALAEEVMRESKGSIKVF